MDWNLFFAYGPFAAFVFVYLVLVRRLGLSFRMRLVWVAVLLVAFSKFTWFRRFDLNSLSPDLPAAVIWGWDWLYSGAMILCLLSALAWPRFRGKAWLLPIAAWGLSALGLWNGVRIPDVRTVELEFANLPASLDGYRILQLSDVHASSAARRWRTQALVERVNAQKADLVCLTGDYVDGFVSRCLPFVEPLRDLRAKDGVFACTGNHEYYFRYREWMTNFYDRASNIRFLTNECVFPRQGLALAGVPDGVGSRKHLAPPPDVRTAFAKASHGEFRVLLQHEPKFAPENFREVGVDLQLSGHSHGGICPGLRVLVARMNGGFTRGLYRFGASVLYVSPGSGQWAGFPMRFFNDSEITLFVLRTRQRLELPHLEFRRD